MQRRTASLIEACLNTLSGFAISLAVWVFVVIPVWGMTLTMGDNLVITALFTVASILRGYMWRRYFNWRDHVRRASI